MVTPYDAKQNNLDIYVFVLGEIFAIYQQQNHKIL